PPRPATARSSPHRVHHCQRLARAGTPGRGQPGRLPEEVCRNSDTVLFRSRYLSYISNLSLPSSEAFSGKCYRRVFNELLGVRIREEFSRTIANREFSSEVPKRAFHPNSLQNGQLQSFKDRWHTGCN